MTDPNAPSGSTPEPQPGYPPYGQPQPYGQQPYGQAPWTGQGGPVGGWGQPPAPKPGVIPLRRLGVGEILDGAISYIRANPKITLGLSAVVITLSQLIQVAARFTEFAGLVTLFSGPVRESDIERMSNTGAGGYVGGLFGTVVGFAAQSLLTGLLMAVISRAVLGRRPRFGEVWAIARPRLLGVFGVILLLVLTLVLVGGVAAGAVVATVAGGLPGGAIAAVALTIVPAALVLLAYLYVSWSLAVPAYVLEDISVLGALRRSFHLVRGQWWRVCGILLLAGVIVVALSFILVIPFAMVGGLLVGMGGSNAGAGAMVFLLVGTVLGGIIAGTITTPFQAGISGLIYYDQRIRREGLDIELARLAEAE